jgi:DNA-binding response OmpR family regulator
MLAERDLMNRDGPGVVLALPDADRAAAVADRLRRRGWRVIRATTGTEARKLACRHLPDAVVLPADGPVESGWLTAAKLLRAQPRLRVVLVGERTGSAARFARFLGATLAPADVGAAELAARVAGAVPQTV